MGAEGCGRIFWPLLSFCLAVAGIGVGSVRELRPTRSNGPWCRPIRTIRRSTRSARRCARPTRMCRKRCPAIARSSASPPTAATITTMRFSNFPSAACSTNIPFAQTLLFAHRRRHRHVHAVQRLPDRQSHPAGRKPGRCRARDLARHRAAGAARCRDRLHEFVARSGDPRSAIGATSKCSPSSSSRRATASMSAK